MRSVSSVRQLEAQVTPRPSAPLSRRVPAEGGGRERGGYGSGGAYCSAYLSTFSLVTTITGVRISWGTFSPFRARMAATTLQ